GPAPLPLFAAAEARHGAALAGPEPAVSLPVAGLGEEVADDYRSLRLSLKAHPLALLRNELGRRRAVPAARLADIRAGARVRVAGLVLVRQRPGTAKGVIFATLEDETGTANVIVWPDVFERFRRTVLAAKLLCVEGEVQREGIVLHVVAARLEDWTPLLGRLTETRTELSPALARADHVARPGHDPRTLPVRSRDFH
ncbi:MAG TPA: OB-fold nucleic acid binding domain-containing protein, partial [Alphaproteobacteria bacterium]